MENIRKHVRSQKDYELVTKWVTTVQRRLQTHGYKLAIDGNWGTATQKAVEDFQRVTGLNDDGIVGDKTLIALNKDKPLQAPHFKDSEFKCKCNGKYCDGIPARGVSVALLKLLEDIRARVNTLYPVGDGAERGIIINSGYRCEKWNNLVGGAAKSQHKKNPVMAADIRVNGVTPKQLGTICDGLNKNGGVGLGGKNIVHVDVRGEHARWWY